MSKEEFLKIQTCVLKVNIHCDGCKSKVKKTLQKIDGVYKIQIDSEMGKVTVSGNVDPATLIKKLGKSGKHAELWGAPKANQGNQNQLNAQFKNLHIDNSKGGNKGQKGGGNQQKAGGGGGGGGGQPGLTPQQLQLLQMKGLQDMKLLPQLKDLKMPFSKDQNQKAVKFNLPEEDDMSDDEFDCFDDEDYDDDDELDDELGGALNPAPNKMKPIMGNGQMPNLMMLNGQQLPQFMNAQPKGGNGANNNGGNGKKGGGGNVPVQVNDGKNDHGGKKGGGGGGGKNGGKNGGGNPGDGKNGNNSGGAQSKNGNGGHGGAGGGNSNNNGNGGKKGGGMNDGVQGLPNMGSGFQGMAGGQLGQMGGMPMGQMGPLPMGQMPAVQGLPAGPLNAGGGGGGVGGYLNGAGQEGLAGNSYQQHLAAAMMNQQRANGNERFQPMMYARPPPAVNYMPPPYQYPYPYPPPPDHPYTHAFSDESTSSCSVM